MIDIGYISVVTAFEELSAYRPNEAQDWLVVAFRSRQLKAVFVDHDSELHSLDTSYWMENPPYASHLFRNGRLRVSFELNGLAEPENYEDGMGIDVKVLIDIKEWSAFLSDLDRRGLLKSTIENGASQSEKANTHEVATAPKGCPPKFPDLKDYVEAALAKETARPKHAPIILEVQDAYEKDHQKKPSESKIKEFLAPAVREMWPRQ